MPALIWVAYGVHGNEISSPDAALLTAYHLLASRNDKLVDQVFANDLVLIDQQQNPDGRDRFVHNFEIAEGLQPDPTQLAAEHNEPWPGGRTNHYYFDMNRDWFALTQPETRGRVKTLLDWYPLVFVDLHEMGSDATYYFAPEAVPYNPYITSEQRDSLEWFGRNNSLVRSIRLHLFHPRRLRRVLSRLWRKLAAPLRLHRHDLRAGFHARSRRPQVGWHRGPIRSHRAAALRLFHLEL